MQIKNKNGFAVVEKCRRCAGEMLYWVDPSRDGAPYHFDRICINCITPAEWDEYYRQHGITPRRCPGVGEQRGNCNGLTQRGLKACPTCIEQADYSSKSHEKTVQKQR